MTNPITTLSQERLKEIVDTAFTRVEWKEAAEMASALLSVMDRTVMGKPFTGERK